MASPVSLILVLGSPNSDSGELYLPARERCDLAISLYHRSSTSNHKILLTGGFGRHFNTTSRPHAFYLQEYLLSRGIPEKDILGFVSSSNTLEDASLSKEIVLKYGVQHVRVITSDYHSERAKTVFKREYAGSGIEIRFCVCETDVQRCEFDLVPLIRHEQNALRKLSAIQ